MADTGRDRAVRALAEKRCPRPADDGSACARCVAEAGQLLADVLDGPDAPAVLREEWDADCGQQFEYGRLQGRDDVAAELAPLLALHQPETVVRSLSLGGPPTYGPACLHCGPAAEWPCPTVAALPAHLRPEATR